VQDEKGDSVISHTILARCQLFNVHGVSDVRQTEIHIAETIEPSAFEVETAIEKLKRHKSPGIDQIQAGLIKAGGRTICSRSMNY
jgi:hypothetical protein